MEKKELLIDEHVFAIVPERIVSYLRQKETIEIAPEKQVCLSFFECASGRPLPLTPDSQQKSSFSRIAVMNITGSIYFSTASHISNKLLELSNDDSIDTIILRVNSPGGTIFGVKELSDQIFAMRKRKRIVALAEPMACSAAYWFSSAASEMYAIPSAFVGSVGVYMMHTDVSKLLEDSGYKITFISAGEKKLDGNPYQPLAKRAEADMQADVNATYDAFTSSVARNRGESVENVLANYGKGGVLKGIEASEIGMVDGTISFVELLEKEAGRIEKKSAGQRFLISAKNELLLLEI